MQTNTIVIIALACCIGLAAFLLAVTVLNCRSEKKDLFIFCIVGILFYSIGNFMEVTSTDTGGALVGVKVMYVGVCFMSPLFLLFLSNYCEVNLPAFVKGVLVGLPSVNLVLVWTTEYTHLIYRKYMYTGEAAVHGLEVVEQGPLYYLVYGTAIVCIVVSVAIIIQRIGTWDRSYTRTLVLFLLASVAPLVANFAYLSATYIARLDVHGINFTPFAILATNLVLYFGVLRYDLFDFSTRARSITFDMVRDAFVFLDHLFRYTASNEIAHSLFPGLREYGKGMPIIGLDSWPEELRVLDATQEYRDVRFRMQAAVEEAELSEGEDVSPRDYNAWVRRVEAAGRTIGHIVQIQDVTDNMRVLRQLENQAYTDGLTGLYNRRYLMDHALKELDRARRMRTPSSLIILDLDHFKKINDTYGHAAGDEVLRYVGRSLCASVRAYDIVARYGGEEFVLFLANAGPEVAAMLAERVRQKIEAGHCALPDGERIPVTCSLGVACAPDESVHLEDLIQRADEALYRAKTTGRNRVCMWE
ncbi:MAG: diguanylate cyclase [Clostridiales Family XIII bacterium]|jgi:diguanylate cyclase (GGDEF)-like protein|nr:diguanylate cyclase [Clostridiales Family XIII bacterium]